MADTGLHSGTVMLTKTDVVPAPMGLRMQRGRQLVTLSDDYLMKAQGDDKRRKCAGFNEGIKHGDIILLRESRIII